MKIVVLYLRILKKWDESFVEETNYEKSSERFLHSYQEFRPQQKHELVIVNCGTDQHDGKFDRIASRYENYNGGGYDCGTYQAIGGKQDCDIVFAFNTHVHFHDHVWMDRIIEAYETFGKGVYGYTASFEHNPHLRTPAIAFHPEIIRRYDGFVDSREKAGEFECGKNNFSLQSIKMGYPVILVSKDRFRKNDQWREGEGIFRRGNQKNCLVWDRHCDIYAEEKAARKKELEDWADGNNNYLIENGSVQS